MNEEKTQVIISLDKYENLIKRTQWTYAITRDYYGELKVFTSPEITDDAFSGVKELFEAQNKVLDGIRLENTELKIKLSRKPFWRRFI